MKSPELFETPANQTEARVLGQSVEGREISAYFQNTRADGTGGPGSTLLIGGMHGDEVATIWLLEEFQKLHAAEVGAGLVVLPLANPDGHQRLTRYNARGVDLNRNCSYNWQPEGAEPPGPEPWSEPEIVILRDLILTWQPHKIVSLHWALAEIDADGEQSTALAREMWAALTPENRGPYRLRVTEPGHGLRRLQQTYAVCPGSLGQWCGYGLEYADGRRPAMITLELPYNPAVQTRPEPLADDHLDELRALWQQDAAGYMRGVAPGVHQMLRAACAFAS